MKLETGTVKVNVAAKGQSDNIVERPVSYSLYETSSDVLQAIQSEDGLKEVLANLNEGIRSAARLVVRTAIKDEFEGPAKAQNKMVTDFVKLRAMNGKPVTEEQAVSILTQMGVFA